MGSRHFPNPYPDYDGQCSSPKQGRIPEALEQIIRGSIHKLLTVLNQGLADLPSDGDYTVYTGFAGQALLFHHLSSALGNQRKEEFLQRGISLLKPGLRHLKGKKYSFLGGDAGTLAVAAVIYSKLGLKSESKDCLKRLESISQHVSREDSSVCDELLFGRVGYIFSLLFVQKHLGQDCVDGKILLKVCDRVIKNGQKLAADEKWACPLMFTWHDKHYLGAAHGMAGILYMLMQVPDPGVRSRVEELVRPTIDFLMTLQFPSGNFPSSIGSASGDKLVHWCHGAPGWVYMFTLAYTLFEDEKYLSAARSCGQVVWERGLLKKGDGICHGSAGNAYVFLSLYRLTREEKYLYRACKFAEWCTNFENHATLQADRPFSLFEGIAGTIYFLADLLKPDQAKFPAFEL
ncbi:glutathione S-transferase LANCL1-like isoform X1 [Liolophura sinensis]|uniref:glutathione S-transferase LANCL1-like isoform X1 n=1 Tax=Liolophura sinensis TaxID=3198878 RepID=UPI0031587B45